MSRKFFVIGGIIAAITAPVVVFLLIVAGFFALLSSDDSKICNPSDTIVTAALASGDGSITVGPHATEFLSDFAKGTQKTQLANAEVIMNVGVARAPDGVTQHDIAIAIATAIQESNLININGGDRDSLGLFQQRPSQGWGTPTQIMDPVYAANKFYDALITVGDRVDRPMIEVAMDVQRPNQAAYYARWRWDAVATEMAGSVVVNPDDISNIVQVTSLPNVVCDSLPATNVAQVVRTVIEQVGQSYTWGDSDLNGFDGSGLYHWAYGQHDLSIPRTSVMQYSDGEKIDRDDLRPGDLVFWAQDPSDASTVQTVAMYIGDDRIVEAPGPNQNIIITKMRWDGFIGATRPVPNPTLSGAYGSVDGWQLPMDPDVYRVTSRWGDGRNHNGIDLAAPAGTPIYAIADGVVTIRQLGFRLADTHYNSGNVVYIRHADGSGSGYAHMSGYAPGIQVGTQVRMGDIIGYVGNTGISAGNHLHLTIETDHDNIVQVDPEPFFAAKGLRF